MLTALFARYVLVPLMRWLASRDAARPVAAYLTGSRKDSGKDPWDLAPWDAIGEVVKVLAFGAQKYAPRNWENGMAWSRCFASLQRHLTAWWQGEDRDPETGILHVAHVACNALFIVAYQLRGAGLDDRPSKVKPTLLLVPDAKADVARALIKHGRTDAGGGSEIPYRERLVLDPDDTPDATAVDYAPESGRK